MRRYAGSICVVTVLLAALPALAQQSKDTVRVGFYEPISSVLLYDDPQPQNTFITRAAFDTLICYSPTQRDFVPGLASSWRYVDDLTLEFTLRSDVVFHDGSRLEAADAAYTLNWLIDPASTYRFRENFSWAKGAHAIDAHTVRIALREPSAVALARLATSLFILPRKIHSSLTDKTMFGRRAPVGTGPYRIESVDPVTGVVLARNDKYPQATECKPAAAIKRIEALPMPDIQTQAAQLMTGGLDLMRIAARETGEMFEHDPRFSVTALDGMMLQYVAFDAANRSGNAALADPRVRRALIQSIDRDAVAASVTPGPQGPEHLDALCFAVQIGCAWDRRPWPFDRAAAKALLAEAGYGNGFDVAITAFTSAGQLAEAIAGEFHKIGVRASVDRVTLAAYRQKQRDGKLQILVALWSSGGLPDVSSTVDLLFAKGPRDYFRDGAIQDMAAQAMRADNAEQRKALYARIFDRANEQSYVLPISGKPEVFVHTRDLDLGPGSLNTYGVEANELRWK